MIIDYDEAARYMGYCGEKPDAQVRALIDEVAAELAAEVSPRHVLRVFPIDALDQESADIGGVHFASRALAERLSGCDEAALFAATLGVQADRLIASYERRGMMSRALAAQAVATMLIESECDSVQAWLSGRMAEKQKFIRERFSPGYGDLALEYQRDMLRLLDAGKDAGITLTDGMMLVPVKSVTAIIGIGDDEAARSAAGCISCTDFTCLYRKNR